MEKLTEINFFICSTFIDLKNYREEVIKIIKSKSGQINAQEFFGARDQKPIKTCIEEVEKSQIFIMLVAFRYGNIESDSQKSFSELEFEKAKELGIPKFIYFLEDEYPFPPKFVDTGLGAEKVNALKDKLRKDFTISHFTTPEDLAKKVWTDLQNQLPSLGFNIKQSSEEEKTEANQELIRKFLLLPKLYHGNELDIEVKLGANEIANGYECDAFSFSVGATIKRKIEPIDLGLKKLFGSTERYVYASFEEAKALVELKEKTAIKIRVKTIQGTYKTKTPIYELIQSNMYYTQQKEKVQTGYDYQDHVKLGFQFISN